jgi:uncharacterized coiled-coil protein SlyX
VAHLFDNAPDAMDDQEQEAPERRRWIPVAVAAGLAVLGVISAVLWRAYGDSLPALPSLASIRGTSAEAADKPVGLKDFQAFQQQVAGSIQSTAQLLAAQQAEIKRLSDQVTALNAKIDTLQRPAASAQASVPPPAAPATPAAPKKKPAPKPAATISTGGAPLPLAAQPSR